MNHNDVIRSLRYTLDASELDLVRLIEKGGGTATEAQVRGYLIAKGEEGTVVMDDPAMEALLDGLIIARRGPSGPRSPEPRVTYNVILKKLRIAFELHEGDLHAIFASGGWPIGKQALSALFRKPDNSHYESCDAKQLRAFLNGLATRIRGTSAPPAR